MRSRSVFGGSRNGTLGAIAVYNQFPFMLMGEFRSISALVSRVFVRRDPGHVALGSAVLAVIFALQVSCLGEHQALSSVHRLRDDWTQALSDLGVVPVYPPREDVKVGDVFVATCDPSSVSNACNVLAADPGRPTNGSESAQPATELAARWFTLDVDKKLKEDYAKRMTPPATPLADLTASSAGPVLQPQDANLYSEGVTDRLRIVGFPEFAAGSAFGADLNAVIPAEALSAALVVNGSKNESVTIKVPSAESYSLPSDIVMTELFQCTEQSCRLKPAYLKNLPLIPYARNDPEKKRFLRVITEVYYARALDVEIGSNSVFGAAAKANLPVNSSNPQDDLTKRVSDLNTMLNSLNAGKTPGGSVSVIAASQSGVTLRRVWERPVAIGVRGVFVTVTADGSLASSRSFNNAEHPFRAPMPRNRLFPHHKS